MKLGHMPILREFVDFDNKKIDRMLPDAKKIKL